MATIQQLEVEINKIKERNRRVEMDKIWETNGEKGIIFRMKIKLSAVQLDKVSDLSLGLGQLLFGSTVLPYIIPALDRPPLIVLLFGISIAILLWIFAVWIVRRKT